MEPPHWSCQIQCSAVEMSRTTLSLSESKRFNGQTQTQIMIFIDENQSSLWLTYKTEIRHMVTNYLLGYLNTIFLKATQYCIWHMWNRACPKERQCNTISNNRDPFDVKICMLSGLFFSKTFSKKTIFLENCTVMHDIFSFPAARIFGVALN